MTYAPEGCVWCGTLVKGLKQKSAHLESPNFTAKTPKGSFISQIATSDLSTQPEEIKKQIKKKEPIKMNGNGTKQRTEKR